MTTGVARALYFVAICLAVISLAGFGYKAFQPNAFNPVGLISLGAGLALIFWVAGLTCTYMIKTEFVTEAACMSCGHTGYLKWKKVGVARELIDSHCFHQPPGEHRIFCKRCRRHCEARRSRRVFAVGVVAHL